MADTATYSASKLVLAEPFGVYGWRGMLIIAVSNSAATKQLGPADPVRMNGEMAPEFHQNFSSAALMLVKESRRNIARQ